MYIEAEILLKVALLLLKHHNPDPIIPAYRR